VRSDNCYRTRKLGENPDVARHTHDSGTAIAPDVIKPNNHATSAQSPSDDLETARCDSNYLPQSPIREKVENAGAFIAIGPSKCGKEHSA